MPTILQDEFRITEQTTGVTTAVSVANTETDIVTFVMPDATGMVIRPGDIFSIYLADVTPTEVATTSVIKVVHTDANSVIQRELANVAYTVLVEWSNRNIIYTWGQRTEISPDERLVIKATADIATVVANTRFQISCLRGTRSIL